METYSLIIDSFRGKYDFLSNMYPSLIEYKDVIYACAEAAYQAQKTDDIFIKTKMAKMDGIEAKRTGLKLKLKDQKKWNKERVQIMREIVEAKFRQNNELAKKLKATKNYYIIEGNKWNDTFWGVCDGTGLNFMGEILMEIRDKLIKEDEIEVINLNKMLGYEKFYVRDEEEFRDLIVSYMNEYSSENIYFGKRFEISYVAAALDKNYSESIWTAVFQITGYGETDRWKINWEKITMN